MRNLAGQRRQLGMSPHRFLSRPQRPPDHAIEGAANDSSQARDNQQAATGKGRVDPKVRATPTRTRTAPERHQIQVGY